MAEEYFGLTCQSLCDALSTLKGAYEATNTDFNLYWSVGEWGKGVHSISESVHVVLSDTISMLKHQQAEIERLKAVINHEPDCANAEHDSEWWMPWV